MVRPVTSPVPRRRVPGRAATHDASTSEFTMRFTPSRLRFPAPLALLLVLALGACERVTAPEAEAAARTLDQLGQTSRWSNGFFEYDEGLAAASGVLRRLEGSATRIVVERDGRRETFNAVVYDYEFAGSAKVGDESEVRRTLVAWQSPGVRNVVYVTTGALPVPFEKQWVDDTTSWETFHAWHSRVPFARQGYLFGENVYWRADIGVATLGTPGAVEARCADGLHAEDKLDEYSSFLSVTGKGSYVPNVAQCDLVSFTVAFDMELYTRKRDAFVDTLPFQWYDRRAIDPRPVRLVALPQPVRGVRFRLRCDATTPDNLRSRCPEGTDFAPRP